MQCYRLSVQGSANHVSGIFEENQGAMALAENPLSSAWIRRINVRFHFVRELLRAKKIDIQFM